MNPVTGDLYTPEEAAALPETERATLVKITEREYGTLRYMNPGERHAWLNRKIGKDRGRAHAGQKGKAKARRRRLRRDGR